ncbi:MAG: tetratricopeptide repeat protein [Spirochaetales bacterium]|nr:tetratricopeptide repeat protein [Spirochaetales bacterium]
MKKIIVLLIMLFLMLGEVSAAPAEKELFSLAESRYYAKNYAVALETYDEFVKTYPLSGLIPDVQYRRAVCLYRLAQYEDALSLLKRIETRYRSTRYLDYIQFWAGLIFYHLKDYGEAVNSLELFLKNTPEGESVSTALFYKGLSEIFLSNYVDGVNTLQTLLANTKDKSFSSSASVLLTFAYLKEANYEEVLFLTKSYDLADFPDPEKAKLLYYQAEALWGLNRIDEAKVIYKQLLTSPPEIASVAYRRLFIAAQQEEDFTEMENLLRKAEEAFSGSGDILEDFWVQIGIENYKRGNLEVAEDFFTKLMNSRKNKEIKKSIPLYLSEIYIQQKKYKKAEEILLNFSKENNNSKETGYLNEIIFRLGDIALMLGDYPRAVEYYETYRGANPEDPRKIDAQYYNAYALYRQGELEKALELTNEVLKTYSAGPYHQELLKLQILLYKKRKDSDATLSALKQYIALYPDDLRGRVDLLKVYFIRKNYNAVILEIQDMDRKITALKSKDSYSYILSRYFLGLSYIVKKEYKDAAQTLSLVQEKEAKPAGLSQIVPYSLFYQGWALYRLGKFIEAAAFFSQLIKNYSGHELDTKALYFAGWCHYSAGNYDQAIVYFSTLSDKNPEDSLKVKALFFKAKSFYNLGNLDEAKDIFKFIFNKMQKSSFADDALYEYAAILSQQGENEEAASAYLTLSEAYPKSTLREDALYRRGEIYFSGKLYEKARDAFYEYRLKFPEGPLNDAALYWGGLSAYYLDEKFGAVLLWEKIIQDYKTSAYRPNALKKTADVYKESGEYSKALSLYSELITTYGREASAVNAEASAEELRYLILGLSTREAELTVIIDRNKGAQTRDGREALIALAKLYLYEEGRKKLELAYKLLLQVIEKTEDPDTASRAQFLIGEYFSLKEDFVKAGNEFLKAALINPKNKDLMAFAIYKAAEMMKYAGKNNEVRGLVERLEKNFPQSHWAVEGRRLLEGME